MARFMDREVAEALLEACRAETVAADALKDQWELALVRRGDAYLAANDGGLVGQDIADHVGRSVGLVKLELGKAKARRGEAKAS